jgi:hypothetical protein
MQFPHLSDFARARQPAAPRWIPPHTVRIAARCTILCAFAFLLYTLWQVERYVLTAQRYPGYELTHKWPGHLLMLSTSITLFIAIVCIPLLRRQPLAKKKHIPDPALSILPR